MELIFDKNTLNSNQKESQDSSLSQTEENQLQNQENQKNEKMMKRKNQKNKRGNKRGGGKKGISNENKIKLFQKQLVLQKRISSITENLKQIEENYLKKKETITKRLNVIQNNLTIVENRIKKENLNLSEEELQKLCHCDCHEHLDTSEKKRGNNHLGRNNSVEKMIDQLNLEEESDSVKRLRSDQNENN
jgi:hypothetical protein